MSLQEQQLGQTRPANTDAVSIYSPGVGVTAIIKAIIVTNTTASSATYRIYVDNNGTTYDESTALFWDIILAANTTESITSFIAMNDSTGNLAVRTDTVNAITFTIFGAEVI